MQNSENSSIISALNEMEHNIIDKLQHNIIPELKNNIIDEIQHNIVPELKQGIIDEIQHNFIDEIKHSISDTNERIDSLEAKFDSKFDTLERKVDNNSSNILRILNTTSKMQKDIADLRDDVETIYSLEKDSRQHLKLS